MERSRYGSVKSLIVLAVMIMLGGVSAILLFSRLPQPQPGGAPPPATVVRAITPMLPTAVTTPIVLTLTPTPEPAQEQAANCMGGDTTLEDARKHAGFKVLSPNYVPENLQPSLIGMNRLFPKGFTVVKPYLRVTPQPKETAGV